MVTCSRLIVVLRWCWRPRPPSLAAGPFGWLSGGEGTRAVRPAITCRSALREHWVRARVGGLVARIVCVHGIGQQVAGERSLLRDWTPTLLGGLARAGHGDAAVAEDVAMGLYGGLFRPAGELLAVGDPMFTAADVEPGFERFCCWRGGARLRGGSESGAARGGHAGAGSGLGAGRLCGRKGREHQSEYTTSRRSRRRSLCEDLHMSP